MSLIKKLKVYFLGKQLLCDSCMYDYDHACNNPARPNATECPDYRKRG